MSGILNSGKLGKLLDRLTAARAGYLDNLNTYLDAAITSRASATDYTTARAAKLDNLDALVSSAGASAPTTSGLKGIHVANANIDDVVPDTAAGLTVSASTSVYDSWTTLKAESTAVGVIELMAAWQIANTSSRDAQLRLSIDGNVVYTSDADLWKTATGDDNKGVSVIGISNGATDTVAFANIAFTDSFTLEFKKTENATGTVEIGALVRYYLTG